MSEPRQIAVVRNYDEFKNALRARADELEMSFATIDSYGMADRHAAHLLAPVPIKHIGPQTFGVLLTALGLKVLVVEDPEAFSLYATDAPKSKNRGHASGAMLPIKRKKRRRKMHPRWSVVMNARRMLILSDQKRKQIARNAAKSRWQKARLAMQRNPAREYCTSRTQTVQPERGV